MFCTSCGAENENNALFCTNCGAKLTQSAAPAATPVDETPAVTPAEPVFAGNSAVTPEVSTVSERGLKWAYFLGYFALWLGVLINAVSGFKAMSGSEYGEYKDLVYGMYGGLKAVDVLYGILLLAFAALGVVSALSIIKLQKRAIKLVPFMYLIGGIIAVVYVILVSIIIGSSAFSGQILLVMVVDVAMFFINKTYFENRNNIFVN